MSSFTYFTSKTELRAIKTLHTTVPFRPPAEYSDFFVIVIVFRVIIPLIYRPKKAFSVLDHERF